MQRHIVSQCPSKYGIFWISVTKIFLSYSSAGRLYPLFFRFSFQFLSLKGILYIHDTDAFFIPGRVGVDLGHIKAGGAVKAIVAEVKERGFRIRACLPAVTYSRGRPICVLVRVLTSTKQRTLLSQAIRSISPKRQR